MYVWFCALRHGVISGEIMYLMYVCTTIAMYTKHVYEAALNGVEIFLLEDVLVLDTKNTHFFPLIPKYYQGQLHTYIHIYTHTYYYLLLL